MALSFQEALKYWLVLEDIKGELSLVKNSDPSLVHASLTVFERANPCVNHKFELLTESSPTQLKIVYKTTDKAACEKFIAKREKEKQKKETTPSKKDDSEFTDIVTELVRESLKPLKDK